MPTRISSRRKRRPGTYKLLKPTWVDPYPAIPGTEPEKRIFEQLIKLGMYFIFQGDTAKLKADEKAIAKGQQLRGVNDDSLLLHPREFKPDFILPEYGVILDPFGIYHHTLADSIKRDFWKGIVYSGAGYAFYHPWWDDQGWSWNQDLSWIDGPKAHHQSLSVGTEKMGYDTLGMLYKCKELWHGIKYPHMAKIDVDAKRSLGYRLGKNLGAGANSVGLANKARARPHPRSIRVRGRRRRTVR